jgi:hypothetical protein
MMFRPFYHVERGCPGTSSDVERSAGAQPSTSANGSAPRVPSRLPQNMRITNVIDTHVHEDHHSGGFALAHPPGAAYDLHESAAGAMPIEPMRKGEETSAP